MKNIEEHFKRKKKFAISILLLMVAGWGVFSFYLIFIEIGWGKAIFLLEKRHMRQNGRALIPIVKNVSLARGWPIADSRKKIDLETFRFNLEQQCDPELKKISSVRPYFNIRKLGAWGRNCYQGVNITLFLPKNIINFETSDRISKLLEAQVKKSFPRDPDFYTKLPRVIIKGNKLELGTEMDGIKIPGNLQVLPLGRSGEIEAKNFKLYADSWNLKYDSSIAILKNVESIFKTKTTCLLEIPVENAQGEKYWMLVRLENK